MLDYVFVAVFLIAVAALFYFRWRARLLASGAFEAPGLAAGPWDPPAEQVRAQASEQERRFRSFARIAYWVVLATTVSRFTIYFSTTGFGHFTQPVQSVNRPSDAAIITALLTVWRDLILLLGPLTAIAGASFFLLAQRHRRRMAPLSLKYQAYAGRGVLYLSLARKCAGVTAILLFILTIIYLALHK